MKAAGGAPANVAAGVAKLGSRASFLGKVGADAFGDFLISTLRDCGVETRGIARDPAARTTLAFVSVAAGGERDFMFYRNPGADQEFRTEDLDEELVRHASIFHFGSISMTGEPSRTATLHAARVAKEAGLLVSFDPNLRINLWADPELARETIGQGARLADVVKVSEEELEWLPEALEPKLLLVTRGAGGCIWRTAAGSADVPGFRVETVDTTGAGDAFLAAMLVRLEERPQILESPALLTEACRFANAAGALATTGRGAIPSLPSRSAVEDFLRIAANDLH